MVRIGVYTPANGSWGFVHYPLDAPESSAGGWVGLSEIVAVTDDEFMVIERLARDLLPNLAGTGGWPLDKLEGLTIASDGQIYAVTDNDGVDDAVGETRFLRLGKSTTVLAQR
jgi:hypothetical protein